MERGEKGRERKGKKQEEFMGIKLKGGVLVGKRGGNSTPTATWRIGFAQPDGSLVQDPNFPIITTLSARKLGANLRGVQSHLKVANMSNGGSRRRHRLHHHENEKIVEVPTQLAEQPDSPTYQPASDSSLRRHIATSLTQHHRSVGRNGHALQLVSPASCSSSLEVAPYYPAVTPASLLDFKRKGEASCSLKTSAKLLKVLNRIWILEEQHASNSSLVKALKRELDYSWAQIKELLQEKRRDGWEMDDGMEQTADDKTVRRNNEQGRMKDAIKALRDELECERKLRKHSESLHRKLARELSEVKSSFSNPLKELERERKVRILLENLCDEFAKGIRDYEQEVRSLKHKPDKDWTTRESPERLILHISEAWLDERMQMKLAEARCDHAEKNTIVEKLSIEIETFLQAKQPVHSGNNDKLASKAPKESSLHRHSLESFHLNDAASAPRNGDYEEDSTGSGLNSFELKRDSGGKRSNGCSKQPDDNGQEILKSTPIKKMGQSEQVLFKGSDRFSLQKQFTEHISRALSKNGNTTRLLKGEPGKEWEDNQDEGYNYQKSETTEVTPEGKWQREKKRAGSHEFNSGQMLHSLTKNRSLSRKGGKLHHAQHYTEDSLDQSAFTSDPSIKQQRMPRISAPEPDISELFRKGPQGIKDHSLKARLLEAKLESQQSRMKTSKGPL